jgi:N utilization substance protein A
LVEEGFLSYDDLSVIEPDALMAMGELSEEEVNTIVSQAEDKAMEAEAAAQEARRKKREEDRLAAIEAEYAAKDAETGGAGRIHTAPTTAAGGEGGEAAANGEQTELTDMAADASEGSTAEEGGSAS